MTSITTNLPKIVVLISGNGSNLQAIIDAVHNGSLRCEITLVISNRKGAYGLTRAQNANIPTLIFPLKPYKDAGKLREDYDLDLADKILSYEPNLIVLAGWMHILSKGALDKLNPIPIINLHPALPGQFNGANAIVRAFEAFQQKKIQHTGIMIHRVIPEVDEGEVILSQEIPIYEHDTLAKLEERIHQEEHILIVKGIQKMLEEEIESHQRKKSDNSNPSAEEKSSLAGLNKTGLHDPLFKYVDSDETPTEIESYCMNCGENVRILLFSLFLPKKDPFLFIIFDFLIFYSDYISYYFLIF